MSVDRLSEGYVPDFDIDARVGRQGELFCLDVANGIRDGSIEVKTDERAADTGRVYVEYECFRRGRWEPSGIKTTQAEFWAFAIRDVLVAAPVPNIRFAARRAFRQGFVAECKRGSHPTKGVCVPLTELLIWALAYRNDAG